MIAESAFAFVFVSVAFVSVFIFFVSILIFVFNGYMAEAYSNAVIDLFEHIGGLNTKRRESRSLYQFSLPMVGVGQLNLSLYFLLRYSKSRYFTNWALSAEEYVK